jgi:hypothetical protein
VRHVTAKQLGSTTLAALGLLACGGHGSGGPGDPLAEPLADPYGSGYRVSELLGPASWYDPANDTSVNCVGVPANREVLLTGATVTAIDRFDETSEGAVGNVYVQDSFLEPVPYSGLTIYDPGFSPPDMRVMQGDVVDVLGVLLEFLGPNSSPFSRCVTLPEMGGSMAFRFEGGSITPTMIAVTDLKDYQTVRPLLGMLVTVENVELTANAANSSGRYSAPLFVGAGVPQSDVPTLTNELFDLEQFDVDHGGVLVDGAVLASVTGIITYFYSTHISPRSAADIVP